MEKFNDILKSDIKYKEQEWIFLINPFSESEDYWNDDENYTNIVEDYFKQFFPNNNYELWIDIWAWIGRCTEPLSDICNTVIAHEASFKALEWMKENRDIKNIVYMADANPILPYKDNTFDVVSCVTVIEHIKDDTTLLNEIYRIIKPGWHVMIRNDAWFHNILEKIWFFWRKVDPTHINMFTWRTLEKKLKKAWFTILEKQMFPYYRWLWKYDKYLPFSSIFTTKANFICTK